MHKLFLALILLSPLAVVACDCPALPLDSLFARANVVCVGTCMDVTPNPIKGDLNVVFQVDSSWKRPVEHVATIHTPNTSCGFLFRPGQKYLVVGLKRHQTVHTDDCSGTMLLPHTMPVELQKLGKAYLPGRPEFASRMNWILLGLGMSGLAFMALIVLRKRIFPRKKA